MVSNSLNMKKTILTYLRKSVNSREEGTKKFNEEKGIRMIAKPLL